MMHGRMCRVTIALLSCALIGLLVAPALQADKEIKVFNGMPGDVSLGSWGSGKVEHITDDVYVSSDATDVGCLKVQSEGVYAGGRLDLKTPVPVAELTRNPDGVYIEAHVKRFERKQPAVAAAQPMMGPMGPMGAGGMIEEHSGMAGPEAFGPGVGPMMGPEGIPMAPIGGGMMPGGGGSMPPGMMPGGRMGPGTGMMPGGGGSMPPGMMRGGSMPPGMMRGSGPMMMGSGPMMPGMAPGATGPGGMPMMPPGGEGAMAGPMMPGMPPGAMGPGGMPMMPPGGEMGVMPPGMRGGPGMPMTPGMVGTQQSLEQVRSIERVRLLLIADKGTIASGDIDLTTIQPDPKGWIRVAVPISQTDKAGDITGGSIKSIAIAGDANDFFYVGQVRLLQEDQPLVADAGQNREVRLGAPVKFAAKAQPNAGPARYAWDFDDLNGMQEDALGQQVEHEFKDPGHYTVTLTVSDPEGAKVPRTAKLSILVTE